MGHKTHPLGFRLGVTQTARSLWYSDVNRYSSLIKEDYEIRQIVVQYLLDHNLRQAAITKIVIERSNKKNKVYVEIQTAVPAQVIGEEAFLLRGLDKKLSLFLAPKKILINIIEIKEYYKEATLLVDILVKKLEERVSFRKAMREIIQRYKTDKSLNGIKIQIAGRLNGAEIARTEWVREGRVPLQTLRADIDYCHKTAQTIYGILGIKIWLFKDEILGRKSV